MPKSKRPLWKRLLRWVMIVFAILVIIFYVVMPLAFGFIATRSAKASVGETPEGFEDLSLTTEDGLTLGAWYAPPQNGAVIILVHGAGGSRRGMRGYADMLVQHGFGVLSLDLRGHGESDGKTNKFGWAGTRDVGAAVEYLKQQDDVTTIGGLGSSLGAEVLLGAVSTYPELQAVVADGASYRSLDEFMALPEHRNILFNFPQRVLQFSTGLFCDDKPPTIPILDSIKAADQTALLFIAGGKKQEEVDFNTYFAEQVKDHGTLWVAPNVGHTGAFSGHREEYEQRVIGLFEENLLSQE